MKIIFNIGILILFSTFFNAYGFKYNCRSVFNPSDVTLGIQNAINSGATKIVIPYMGLDANWISGPLTIKNKKNIEIVFESGVVLESKSGAFTDQVPFITIIGSTNIKINGLGAEIKMLKKEFTDKGEWRHGISILSSDSIEIYGLLITNTGGDGIYVGSSKGEITYSSNIIIQDIIADKNARNGISVISCKNLLIENCEIKRTGVNNSPNNASDGPWAGIDLEPNSHEEILENVIINNCIFRFNKGAGVLFANGGAINTISITNNEIHDNAIGIELVGEIRVDKGNFFIKNNNIFGQQDYGLYIINWNTTNLIVDFENCKIDNHKIAIPIKFAIINENNNNVSKYGNISFGNTLFTNVNNICLVYLEGNDALHSFDKISFEGTERRSYGDYNDFNGKNMNLNSYYIKDTVEGENIFCCVEKSVLNISINPNPFSETFLVRCNTSNPIDLQIFDMKGNSVYYKSVRNGEYGNCQNLPDGQYVVRIKDVVNQRISSIKAIKKQ